MAITQSEYSELKIDRIQQVLQNQERLGKGSDYEIFVDTFKVVPRTNDLDLFESYTTFVDADTKSITITLFHGVSNRNDKHILRLQAPKEESLHGLANIEDKMEEKLNQEREKWQHTQLEKKHKKLKNAYADLEKYSEKLERDLVEAKSNKHKIGNLNVAELGSVIIEGIVRRNPQILNGLPGGEALAGAFEADNKTTQKVTYEEASFKKKESIKTLSKEDQALLEFGRELQERFSEEEILQIMQILDCLSQDKTQIQILLGKLIAHHQYHTTKQGENNYYPKDKTSNDIEGDP